MSASGIAPRLEVPSACTGLTLAVSTSCDSPDISALVMDPESGRALVYAKACRCDVSLNMAPKDEALWVGRTAFDLSRASCEALAAKFGFRVRGQGAAA